MSSKGFEKDQQKKNRKTHNIFKAVEDSGELIQIAEMHQQFMQELCIENARKIRDEAEKEYGIELIKARSLILCALFDLIHFKAGLPGNTNDNISERLVLISNFAQGQFVTEKLISEGQHVKASAALKQDIEIVTRLYEIKKGVSKLGKTPNVKYAPGNLKGHYGDMNDISHISKAYILDNISGVSISEEIRAVSITPLFHAEATKKLYELHINLCYLITLEATELFKEMYGDDEEMFLPASNILNTAIELLQKAGWIFTNFDHT
ncbi:hypothetical protein NIES4075_65530 [Tolypothrix sp. NIES-4075]|uniref:hypothetical protein n=1 Tax=Tolypothrix sp. NIES-4075 TaxID=2005459 RepID=UPI000B5C2B22|nr:hypothetical protein [Tolypothrix sp. NIES-4075]GAX45532.1 hypothetical protein NIES4075_65530 [Tolypothrix sp. NIES-4075]